MVTTISNDWIRTLVLSRRKSDHRVNFATTTAQTNNFLLVGTDLMDNIYSLKGIIGEDPMS